MRAGLVLGALLYVAVVLPVAAASTGGKSDDATFSQDHIVTAASDFFGGASRGVAKIIEKVFREQGRPDAYITGEEVSGAIGVGLRYGRGKLVRKQGGGREVYWQGPSIGFDFGGNASKVFVLIYNLKRVDQIFQRFPAVDGSFYYVAGLGVNYQRSGDIVLAPIRAGVGLRAGASIGYMHYTRHHSWVPF